VLVYYHFWCLSDACFTIFLLKMLGVMDELWRLHDLDLRVVRYTCVATGPEQGLIEVVQDAATTADIQRKARKKGMSKTPMARWLREVNQDSGLQRQYAEPPYIDTFIRSLAGSCVAMYILGIGDRHNDNIMVTKFGHLFHIDFGHILGNTLTFAGVKRETAPFVLTPEMIHVMGGVKSSAFNDRFHGICGSAYNTLRHGSRKLMVLFSLMLAASLPQLNNFEDMLYLRTALQPALDDEAAVDHFDRLITKSRKTTRTLLNNAVHIWAHPK
jgi:phosphatidylinositol-4,5-bisphosphate 3-kinase catalytic subunit alpha/beta/delta